MSVGFTSHQASTTANYVNKNLTAIPPAISERRDLKEVYLDGNQISQIGQDSLKFPNLRTLSLCNNKISILPDGQDLPSLKILKINDNPSLSELTDKIGSFEQLEELEVSGCGLSKISPLLARLQKLRVLKLSKNSLNAIPECLLNLPNLQKLDLSRNQIRELPKDISAWQALTHLNLSFNAIQDLPESIGGLISLKEIFLTRNQLTQLPNNISKLASLSSFYIGDNQITRLDPKIASLSSLNIFDVSNNRLSAIPHEIFSLRNLNSFSVSGNPFDGSKYSPMHTETACYQCHKNGYENEMKQETRLEEPFYLEKIPVIYSYCCMNNN